MTDRPVTAGWAVWSKEPGTRDDYSVLACSAEPFSKGEFARLLAHFAPGSPSSDEGTPASLPWVTLSRVGVAKELYLGISVQTATSDKDGAGRPISRTTYFCVPYAPLAGNPVSYRDLYAAVADPGLLAYAGRNIVPLAIPPLDPAALAQMIRGGFGAPELVTRTAAMLLGGPVTVTGPKFPGLADRLRFFDAVTALLPYGYRAHLTAATWSDVGAGDRFRLVFADRARDDVSRVRWGTPPPPPGIGPAAAYLGYLDRALEDEGRLESLIADLAGDGEPCKFEDPGRAVERIQDFFRPTVVAERVDAGAARLSDVRRLFTDGRVRELPAPGRAQLLRRLIRGADQQDMGLVVMWYDEVAGDDPGALLTDVAVACRSRLWSSGSTALAREYLRLRMLHDLTDELLARLVPRPAGGIESIAGLDALSQLLADLVVAPPADPGSFPRTQRAVAANLAAGAALLACLAASGQPGSRRLELAAEWLEPVADQIVAPFVALLGDLFGNGPRAVPEAADAAVIAKLDRNGDHASVRYLLRAASYRKRLHLVLPGFAGWLVAGRDEATEQGIRYWGEVVHELTPATAAEAAWLDLVLLLTGSDPRTLLSGRYGQPQFSQQLAQAWQELVAMAGPRGGAADELAEAALTAFLERASWRTDRAQAIAVEHLVRALTEKVPRPRLLAVALDPGETLRQLPPGAAPEEIARACARAHANGLKYRQVIGALIQSGAITSAEQAAEVIEHLHRELSAAGVGDEAFTWPLGLAATLAQGVAGRPRTADFPALAAERYSEEILFRIKLLDAVARYAPPDAPPAIDSSLIEYLEGSRHDLDELLKDARKRQPRASLKGLIRGTWGGEPKPPELGEPGTSTGSVAGTPGSQGGPV